MGRAIGVKGVRTAEFRLLTGAWVTSLVGDGVRTVALPLYTAVSTRSPLAASAVAVAVVLPWLVVAFPAGVLVDRWRPRLVVAVAHTFRAVVTGLLAYTVFTDSASVAVLCAAGFLLTSAETFADTASQVLLVEIAGPDDLEQANGRFVTAETVGMDLAGPLAASLLFWWNPAACFALDALTFVVATFFVLRLPEVPREGHTGLGTLRSQLVEGASHLVHTRGLRVLVLAVGISAVCAAAVNAMLALYSVNVLGMPEQLMPWLVVVMALGALLGARLSPALAPRLGNAPVMVGALALLGVAFAVFGAVPLLPVAIAAVFCFGLASAGWNVLSATRRQRLTPTPLMGRVTSAYRVLAWGLSPIGAGLAGPLAAATSLGTVYLVAGGVVVLTAVALARPLART
ncbi:MFS family permease [Saccharothrix tamanrassetensis]|uniref:MFS family permease n=1 Tax=Saccharothrix tamanrassetensis TaxID=1051531 RepID=A0A841CJL7_9PSEU|nr:MFS transporter [Saccharothrix tamanrassetensis]MBB5957671.1 MFS family permease [Saccharothrix tamanrassetensis]